jgi:uncharacterized protein (DUF2235 family)
VSFDGYALRWLRGSCLQEGIPARTEAADPAFDESHQRGPIPQGRYLLDPTRVENPPDGGGPRIPLEPYDETLERVSTLRGDENITTAYLGVGLGLTGSIELEAGAAAGFIERLAGLERPVELEVRYEGPLRERYERVEQRYGRNLVLCSDGTGNSAGKGRGTNVIHLYESLDRHAYDDGGPDQLAVHDDGVGTSGSRPLALLGGAFGFGLARNVRQLYGWLSRNYRPGDRIFAFGFSRGAFTVRCLAGMIGRFGVVRGESLTDGDLDRLVRRLWDAYKEAQHRYRETGPRQERLAGQRDAFHHLRPPIEFLGVWDTVDAYGLPVDELKEALVEASQLLLWLPVLQRFTLTRFKDRKLHSRVRRAHHAVAIDDERHTFHPVLWDESHEKARAVGLDDRERTCLRRIEQVWFAGMHSDVGGGYSRDSLARVSLDWMMNGAAQEGLRFDQDRHRALRADMDPTGPIHDSRAGLATYYRFRPRDVGGMCAEHGIPVTVHSSVLARIDRTRGDGAPTVLPSEYDVVGRDRYQRERGRHPLAESLTVLRGLQWWRSVLYYLFIAWTAVAVAAAVALAPGARDVPPPRWGPLGYVLSFATAAAPDFVGSWISGLRARPLAALALVAALLILYRQGMRLRGWIRIEARRAWGFPLKERDPGWRGRFVRTGASVSEWIWPGRLWRLAGWVGALAAVGLAVMALTGRFDLPPDGFAPREPARYAVLDREREVLFRADDPGRPLDFVVEAGRRYRVDVAVVEPWMDGGLAAGPGGLTADEVLAQRLARPFKRRWGSPYMSLMGAVGSVNGPRWVIGEGGTFTARRTGRVRLFVNDVTCYLCWNPWHYYRNNQGSARVRIAPAPVSGG